MFYVFLVNMKRRERASEEDDDSGALAPWIPPNVLQQFIPYYITQPMNHPELYDRNAKIDIIRLFMLFGRSGNAKGRTLSNELVRRAIPCTFREVSPGKEKEEIGWLFDRLEALRTSGTGEFHVIVIENSEQLNKSHDPEIYDALLSLPQYLDGLRVIVIMSYGVTPNALPRDITAVFPAQVYWQCPNDDWRVAYFRQAFDRYKALVEHSDVLHVIVEMEDDDNRFLTECSHFSTIEELDRFVNIVFASTHRIGQVHHCDLRGMTGTEAGIHEDCVREINGVVHRVICLTRIREHHLKDLNGVYSISAMDTKTLEDMFHSSAQRGFLAEPDDTHKCILYEDIKKEDGEDGEEKEHTNGKEPVKKKTKMITVEDSGVERFEYDPKTGKARAASALAWTNALNEAGMHN